MECLGLYGFTCYSQSLTRVTDWSDKDDDEVDHRPAVPAAATARSAGDGMSSDAESDGLI